MAQPKRFEIDAEDHAKAQPSRTRPTGDLSKARPYGSPALELMAHAARSLGDQDETKWSARRTLGFVTLASTGLWAVIGSAVYLALR